MRRLMNVAPRRGGRMLLALLPFVLIVALYLVGSVERRAANPNDKLLPPFSEMADAVKRAAFEPDRRTGEYVLWADTAASLRRLAIGLGIATAGGLMFGLAIGVLPLVSATIAPLIGILSMIPPMAVLPILFIVFGLGELSKVVLIVFGVAPFLVRDLALAISNMPVEQLVKAQTLGASTWQVAIRVVLPQIMPRLIEAVRLSIGPAFLFLISAEAIAAENGLGYRIFLMRRYLAMDVILPYVVWITFLAFIFDWALARHYAGLFRLAGGAVGRGQEHVVAHDPRSGTADARPDHARRQADVARAGTRPRRRIPALFGVSASVRRRQCAARL
jgi:NitT/TauT family transport system permease protein